MRRESVIQPELLRPERLIDLAFVRMPACNILAVAVVILLASSTCSPVLAGGGTGARKSPGPSHVWVPNSAETFPQLSPQGIDVFRAYTTEPAPMGIADYGVGPGGFYQYSTSAFLASVYIVSLQTRNATGDPSMGFQLNAVLVFVDGNVQHAYWVQDVAQIDTSTNQIFFIDNIWNLTSPRASMSWSAIAGSGQVSTYKGIGYYYDVPSAGAGNGINLAYPATVSFLVTTSLNSAHQPTVAFEYEDGSGFQTFDTVSFTTANHVTAFNGFEVNGNNYNPAGTYLDSELVLGGPGGGLSTADVKSDLRMSLSYWNGNNYQTVPNTYNFGSDTAETISNAASLPNYVIATGSLIARVQDGAGSLGRLHTQSGSGTISVQTPLASGTLYVSNSTFPNASPFQTAFTGSPVTISVYPGTYLLQIYVNGAIYDSGTATVGPGQTLQLRTPLGDIQITMSYSVSGGSGGFAPPTLTYVHGGALERATLATSPTTYYVDPGTAWTVTPVSTTAKERWQTTQQDSGTASSYQTIQFTYFHQYRVSFAFSIIGGGVGYSGPNVTYAQFGIDKTTQISSPVWADAGSNYSFPALPGSSSSERWEALSPSGLVSGAGTIGAAYYHQFALVLSYAIVGGGNPTIPVLDAEESGKTRTETLRESPAPYFLDSGSSWSVPNPLQGSSSQERWVASGTTNGTVTAASTLTLSYQHQYYLKTSSFPSSGGSVTNLTGWHDQGIFLKLSASPNSGWKFAVWNGSGAWSYTGYANSTLIVVGSPMVENATFYPGLRIAAGSNGQISYSVGASKGSVQAGNSVTVFAPTGTEVNLQAIPSSFLYDFAGWTPATNSTGSSVSLVLASPSSVQGIFSISLLVVGGIAGGVAAAVLVSALLLRRRSPG